MSDFDEYLAEIDESKGTRLTSIRIPNDIQASITRISQEKGLRQTTIIIAALRYALSDEAHAAS